MNRRQLVKNLIHSIDVMDSFIHSLHGHKLTHIVEPGCLMFTKAYSFTTVLLLYNSHTQKNQLIATEYYKEKFNYLLVRTPL